MSRSVDGDASTTVGKHMRELRLQLGWRAFSLLGVEELLSRLGEPDRVRFRSLSCRGASGTSMLVVDEPVDTSGIKELHYVDSFELVGHGPNRYEYLLRMEMPRCQNVLEEQEGEFYVDGPIHLDDDGLTFTAIATQEALDRLDTMFGGVDGLDSHLEILHIGTYTGRDGGTEVLTERQREVLSTAVERDYFDVPRGVTAEELAAEFDLDKSTVLEHIRRGERNLLERMFGPDGVESTS